MKKIVIGLLAGFVSGLFSSGGGMVLVPAFVYILKLDENKARMNSVFCILPMVIASGFFFYKNNYIDWKIGTYCAIGGVIGGFLGAKILSKIPDKYLKMSFLIFLIYCAIKMII